MKRTQPWLVIVFLLIASVSLQAQLVEAIDITNMIYVPDDGQYGPWKMDAGGKYILGNKMPGEWDLHRVVRHETANFVNGDNYWPGSYGSINWQGSGGQISQANAIASNGAVVGSFTWDYFEYDADGDTLPDTLFNATIASIADPALWGEWKTLGGILDDSLAYGSTSFSKASLISDDGNVIFGTMAYADTNEWGGDQNFDVPFIYHLDSMHLDMDLPGRSGGSIISTMSGDGSILIGSSKVGWTSYPFIWRQNAEGGYDSTAVDSPIVDMGQARISVNGKHITGNGPFNFNGQAAYMMTEIDGVDTLMQMAGLPGMLGGPGAKSVSNDGTAFGLFQEVGGPWGGPMHPWMWHAEGGAKDVAYALESLGMEIPTGEQAPFDQGQIISADSTGKKLFVNWTNANWEAAYSWVILPDVAPPTHLEIAYDNDNHVVPATLELEWENVLPYAYTYRLEVSYMPYGGTWGTWTELANNYDDDDFDHAITEGGYYKYQIVSLYGADESMATESMPYEVRRLMDEPAIIAVTDVPEDQGGKVVVSFAASGFDILGDMTNELYTVESYIADQWVAVGNTAAYGSNEYSVLVNTIHDSMDEGVTNAQDYRIVAALGEDAFISATASGYSTDDIAPPVPTGLAGEILDGTGIALSWDPVNINDLGLYEVYRGSNPEMTDGVVIGQTASTDYTDSDVDFVNGATYYYAVAGLDIHENLGEATSSFVMTVVNIDLQGLPEEFALNQNYPNPFNPSTSINFSLPEASEMTLTVYDLSGREVARLVDASMNAGFHQVIWNGLTAQGETLSTGMYIYRMQAGTYTETRKMTYLR
ncbi:MAG: T9SS type A sorting domain-containing protein [FCB group bacterium]|nr:T9SS type A sorting domain-containing protein [FCB group bacterium]MBL7028450.1 T9SS type A sorting domain-containing protein [Candidatus Neomarinimicrobiota bacterium]MBL7122364.1 T9SS type A sorting domain-containing protein [Candidatus Neomarinimicrobiota bacterium]